MRFAVRLRFWIVYVCGWDMPFHVSESRFCNKVLLFLCWLICVYFLELGHEMGKSEGLKTWRNDTLSKLVGELGLNWPLILTSAVWPSSTTVNVDDVIYKLVKGKCLLVLVYNEEEKIHLLKDDSLRAFDQEAEVKIRLRSSTATQLFHQLPQSVIFSMT